MKISNNQKRITRLIAAAVSVVLFTACFSPTRVRTSSVQVLIDTINSKSFTARSLIDEAEKKRAQAKEKTQPADRAEHDQLIDETAKLYGDASHALTEAAQAAEELAKVRTPTWYEEYFTLQAKLLRNLAYMGSQAHDELLIRKSGQPSDAQVAAWLQDLTRIKKENETYRQRIATIESRERVVLINH